MVRSLDPSTQAVTIAASEQIVQRTFSLLERQIDDAVATKPMAVDLVMSKVQVIDSAGLNWLLGILSRLDSMGIRLRLSDPSPLAMDILQATRMDTRFILSVNGIICDHSGGVRGGD